MQTITINQMKSVVSHIAMRMKMPVMVWGKPGVGKSEGMAQAAAEVDGILIDIRLSQYDSVDLRGIPVPDSEEELTIWHAPSTLPFKSNPRYNTITKPIFLFLDEINGGTLAVQAAAYQLVNDRGIGEHRLMDNVYVVAAGNREGDKGVTNRMPLPLANRFVHVEVDLSVEELSAHFTKIGLPPVLVAFLNFRKQLVSTFDPTRPDKAFATSRTWEKAGRIFADDTMPQAIKEIGICGAVGDGPASEFLGFVDVWHKVVPIREIIKDPLGCPIPQEMSMLYATAMNVSGSLDPKKPTEVDALHAYLKRMDDEFVVLAWKMALTRDNDLLETDAFLDLSKVYRGVLAN